MDITIKVIYICRITFQSHNSFHILGYRRFSQTFIPEATLLINNLEHLVPTGHIKDLWLITLYNLLFYFASWVNIANITVLRSLLGLNNSKLLLIMINKYHATQSVIVVSSNVIVNYRFALGFFRVCWKQSPPNFLAALFVWTLRRWRRPRCTVSAGSPMMWAGLWSNATSVTTGFMAGMEITSSLTHAIDLTD